MRFGLIGCGWIYPAYGEDGRRAIEATLASMHAARGSTYRYRPAIPLYAGGVGALV